MSFKDPHEFFNELLTQVYSYQEQGPFMIMGDFNSRCGDHLDFIEGVDEIPHRQVIDYSHNKYGNIFVNSCYQLIVPL